MLDEVVEAFTCAAAVVINVESTEDAVIKDEFADDETPAVADDLAEVCKVVATSRQEQALESFLGLLAQAVAQVGRSVVAVDDPVVYVAQKGEAEAAEAVKA